MDYGMNDSGKLYFSRVERRFGICSAVLCIVLAEYTLVKAMISLHVPHIILGLGSDVKQLKIQGANSQ